LCLCKNYQIKIMTKRNGFFSYLQNLKIVDINIVLIKKYSIDNQYEKSKFYSLLEFHLDSLKQSQWVKLDS